MILIRKYAKTDYDQVTKITIEVLHQPPETAKEVIQHATDRIFVIEDNGKIMGFVMLEFAGTEWNQTARIGWIAVIPTHQRKRFGSELLRKAEEYAKEKGIRKIYLDTEVTNVRALCFYVKNGYVPEGLMKDYYKDGLDGILLGKHL